MISTIQNARNQNWTDPARFVDIINNPWYKSIAKLQDVFYKKTNEFFYNKGLKYLALPITTSAVSSPMGKGSDSLPVKINLCGVDTYLADSMQFMLEYGCRFFEEGCFYIMQSFRGESADKRHLCQFIHSEAEIYGNLQDVMNLVEEYVKFLAQAFIDECEDIINEVAGNCDHIKRILTMDTFKVIEYKDAVNILKDSKDAINYIENDIPIITSTGEKILLQKYGDGLWIKNFYHLSVPFYQGYADNTDEALNADLLLGIGEVVGSGERATTFSDVLKSLKEHEVNPDDYMWYIEMKKRYPINTAGFGMGMERFLLWVLKHDDIRDCQILPRFNGQKIEP
jgi:asparaginyl-tRNA synthetase